MFTKLSISLENITRLLAPRWLLWTGCMVRLLTQIIYATLDNRGLVPLKASTLTDAGTDGYLQIARNLYLHGTFGFMPDIPSHTRPPVQPILMLIFGAWWDEGWWIIWFVFTLINYVLGFLLMKKISEALKLPHQAMKLCLLLFAFHPMLVLSSRSTTIVPIATTLLLITIWMVTQAHKSLIVKNLLIGISLGVASLTHGTLLPAALITPLILKVVDNRNKWHHVAISLLASLLMITPWTLRNYFQFNKFIPVVTGAGYQYWKGLESTLGPKDVGEITYQNKYGNYPPIHYYSLDYPEDDSRMLTLAYRHIIDHPQMFFKRMVLGLYQYWAPSDPPGTTIGKVKSYAVALLNFPLLLGTTLLLVRNRKPIGTTLTVCLAIILMQWFSFGLFATNASYFVIVLPLLFIVFCILLSPQNQVT